MRQSFKRIRFLHHRKRHDLLATDCVTVAAGEPFFSTKGQHENSGLGLSQVQGFVQQSGGDAVS